MNGRHAVQQIPAGFRLHLHCSLRRMVGAVTLLCLLTCALPCWADPAVTARADSENSFSVDISGLMNASAIELTISFDSETLTNPVITKGAFAQRAQFDSSNVGSMVKITISRSKNWLMGGAGTLASLRFTRAGALPGKLTSITSYYRDREERQFSMDAAIIDLPDTPATDTGARTTATETKPASADASPATAATIALPPAAAGAAPVKEQPGFDASTRVVRIASVLERFRTHDGATDRQTLKGLFSRENDAGIRQQPLAALTDGLTPLTVTLPYNPRDGGSLNFNLEGAHLTRLFVNDEGRWEMLLLPDRGNYSARLSMVSDSGIVEFPLTIAPPPGNLPEPCPDYLLRYIQAAQCLAASAGTGVCPEIE